MPVSRKTLLMIRKVRPAVLKILWYKSDPYSHLEFKEVRIVEFRRPDAHAEEGVGKAREIETHSRTLEKPGLILMDAHLPEKVAAASAERR